LLRSVDRGGFELGSAQCCKGAREEKTCSEVVSEGPTRRQDGRAFLSRQIDASPSPSTASPPQQRRPETTKGQPSQRFYSAIDHRGTWPAGKRRGGSRAQVAACLRMSNQTRPFSVMFSKWPVFLSFGIRVRAVVELTPSKQGNKGRLRGRRQGWDPGPNQSQVEEGTPIKAWHPSSGAETVVGKGQGTPTTA